MKGEPGSGASEPPAASEEQAAAARQGELEAATSALLDLAYDLALHRRNQRAAAGEPEDPMANEPMTQEDMRAFFDELKDTLERQREEWLRRHQQGGGGT